MSVKRTLAKALVFAILQFGALSGSVTPEEIEKVMNLMHKTKIVQVMKKGEPEKK